ncbi:hypothetical protein MHO82_02180 [Vibrio sp. Of7-15]|uniref:hypothetical protein n=1 Tax=Vibrio sp. Of7-15 TaxID=2724879 RepID=UPI001EF3106D|nr:hypothetical protein [Vibrio sp. Of7-15]MCG7495664.1 hypothetical protein [Vibrio sp. Of7-15]
MRLSIPDAREAHRDNGGPLMGHTAYSIYRLLSRDEHHFQANRKKYLQVINDIRLLYYRASGQREGGAEVFKGGQVMLADNKMFYRYWRSLIQSGHVDGGSRDGMSSHNSVDEQFEVLFPNRWGNVLFGTRNGGTWFQTEAYGFTAPISTWGGFKDTIGHVSTTVQYGLSGMSRQVGTCGYSPHTEARPLRLQAHRVPDEPT